MLGAQSIGSPRSGNATWRRTLASAALLAYGARPVRAQGVPPPPCSVSQSDPTVVNCTGDLSAGVNLDNGTDQFRTLNAFNLTTNIAPAGGGARYDTRRVMSFGSFSGVAEGDQQIGMASGGLRAAYAFGDPSFYLKPILDANLTHLHLGSFAESGGNGAGLAVQGGGQTVFTIAPALEAGTEWWLANGTLVRPLLRAGGIWYSNDDLALTASFESAPAGVGPFTINTKLDQVMGLIGAGLDVINGSDAVLRFSYDGQFGETTQIHSVGIKGSAKF